LYALILTLGASRRLGAKLGGFFCIKVNHATGLGMRVRKLRRKQTTDAGLYPGYKAEARED